LHRGHVPITSTRSTTITTSHARPVVPIPSHDLSNGRAQRVDIKRLRDHGADTETRGMVVEVGGRREQKDGYLPLHRFWAPTPRQESLRIHLRHDEVEQDHVCHPSLQKVESVLTARTDLDIPPFVGERQLQHLTDREVVVHDEYARSFSYHHAS